MAFDLDPDAPVPPPPPRDTPPPRPTRKLAEGVYLVYGARNAAIYDLERGEAIWLERDALLALERGEPVLERLLGRGDAAGAALPRAAALALPRGGSQAEELPIDRARSLAFLWIELTSGCNLACGHCYASSGGGHRTAISAEGYGRLIDQAAELGCRRVQLTGGEPLLHPDLLALVDRARGHGIKVEVYSNLALLQDSLADELAARDVWLATSFYSDRAEDHEAVTRVPGSFESTVAGIRRAVARSITLRVGIVLMGEGRERAASTIAFLRSLGVPAEKIRTGGVLPAGRGRGLAQGPGGATTPCVRGPGRAYLRKLAVESGKLRRSNCWGGELSVTASGSVGPCVFERRLALGRIDGAGAGLAEAVRGERARSVWSITLEDCRVCRDCEFRYACFDCRFLAFRTTGDLYAKPPSCTYDPTTGRDAGSTCTRGRERPPRPRDGLAVEELGDGLALRDASSGEVHVLSPSAAAVFDLCDGERDVPAIARIIAGTVGAELDAVLSDVERTVDELAAKGLVLG